MSCNNTFSNLLNVFTTNSLSAIWKIHKNCVFIVENTQEFL